MKKAIAVFFILLLMEAVVFAQSSLVPEMWPIYQPTYVFPTVSTDNTCLVGSPTVRTFADQMDKSMLTAEDTFLKKYKEDLENHIIPKYFQENPTHSYVDKNKILCAMKRIPLVSQNKKTCSTSSEDGKSVSQTPCITDQVVDYIHWGLNEAFKCYGNILDSHERKFIFKKINHESAFGFFFQYAGGAGIAQLIGESKRDLFIPGNAGYRFLQQQIYTNTKSCDSFVQLLKRTTRERSLKSCEFISIGDGIGRSLIGGIGLYLHYRSDHQNPYSAEKLLDYWGYYKRDTENYKLIRSYITLGMYNKGPWGVIETYKKQIGRAALARKSDKEAFNTVMNLIKRSNFYGYIKAIENDTNKIFDKNGFCKI